MSERFAFAGRTASYSFGQRYVSIQPEFYDRLAFGVKTVGMAGRMIVLINCKSHSAKPY